jgi:TRAP-type C4-dicarboxylate transport system permease small subunit
MRLKAVIFACVLVLAALAGLAWASVRIYDNDFSRRSDVKALDLSGKGCEADLRGNKGQLGVRTAEGGSRCRLRLPVQGDAARPDHIIEAQSKLLPSTDRKVRKRVYVALTVREGGGGFYELRVYPERREYRLVRKPGAEGFPVSAKDNAIGETAEKNRLTLRALGNEVSAKVGKVGVSPVTDPAPNDLSGTKLSLVLGQEGGSKEGAAVWFSDLQVKVPNP